MARKEYDWEIGAPPPKIGLHSIVKHEILRAYIASYVGILAANPAQRVLRLTIVDGFAGGGLYLREDNGQEHEGSPIQMLRACQEAEYTAKQNRRNEFSLLTDFFFVEKKPSNCQYLQRLLHDRGYAHEIGRCIYFRNADINDEIPAITRFIEAKGRARRAIFLLDQYGYDQVPKSLIRTILARLPNAEIIFTFNVDSLITFLSDNDKSRKLLERIELADALRDISLADLKAANPRCWRQVIQARLYDDLVAGCGARHFTPFFIRPGHGFGNYWLIHLSMHHRARAAMVDLHWARNNNFIHFGGAGLNMLGYVPRLDVDVTRQLGIDFLFDADAAERSKIALQADLASHVAGRNEPVSFETLFAETCNTSPATAGMYKEALAMLIQYQVVDVSGTDGAKRREAKAIRGSDVISMAAQRRLFV